MKEEIYFGADTYLIYIITVMIILQMYNFDKLCMYNIYNYMTIMITHFILYLANSKWFNIRRSTKNINR